MAEQQESWFGRHWQKFVAVTLWASIAGGFFAYTRLTGRTTTETLSDIVGVLRQPYGPLLYILIYAIRPLTFFSAVVVSLLGGAIWGPVLGLIIVIVGSNTSASVGYLFGRMFGQRFAPEGAATGQGIISRYAERLRRNAFTTSLVMHLIYLPYDLVNYLSGFLRVPYRQFILGTAMGAFPGSLTFVLAGSSLNIQDILAGQFSVSAINPWTLVLSAAMFVVGISISRYVQRREAAQPA